MRPLIAVALGAALLAGALVATAPATLFDARIAALSGGRMRMADAAGTIWRGSGELVLLPSATRQPVRWRLDALPLFRGEVRGTITAQGAPGATIAYGGDHFELRDLDLSLPAASIVRAAGATKIGVGVGGNLVVHVEHLLWLPNTLDTQLSAQWREASVPGARAGASIALGEVSVDLNGRGAELSGPVHNAGGDVEISGELAVAAAGSSKLDLTLRQRATDRERAENVAAALSMLGSPDGQGGYRVRWAGAWR